VPFDVTDDTSVAAALPLLRRSGNPVVVNVTSSRGSFWAGTNPERRESHYPAIVYRTARTGTLQEEDGELPW
jgi:hypothetical protein